MIKSRTVLVFLLVCSLYRARFSVSSAKGCIPRRLAE